MGYQIIGGGQEVEELSGYLDGMSQQRQELFVEIELGEVYLDIQAIGGGDIDYYIDKKRWVLDCTTGDGVDGKARVQLLQGTYSTTQINYIYAAVNETENKLELYSSQSPPSNNFVWVAYAVILDDVKTLADSPLVLQRLTEAVEHNGRSAISWGRERLRSGDCRLLSGCDQYFNIVSNAGSEDNVLLTLTNAVVFQLHRQMWENYDISTQGIWVANSDGAGSFDNYTKFTDLKDVLHELKDGTTLNDGDIVNFYIWGAINYNGDSKVFVNISTGKYTVEDDAKKDVDETMDLRIPNEFRSVSFSIMRGIVKWNTLNSGTWTNVLSETVQVWKSVVIDSKTTNYPSKYPNNMDIIQTFTQPGALKVRMVMNDFDMESNYDFAEFKNGVDAFSSTVTARRSSPTAFSGDLAAFTSPEIDGDTIRVNYTSDGSVTRSGAQSVSLEYLESTAGAGSEIRDYRGKPPEFKF